MKADIVYTPEVQISDGIPVKSEDQRIRIAKPCLIHEFYTQTQSDTFYVIDFKTFVKIYASQYKDLALSFQLAIAEEEKESVEAAKIEVTSSDEELNNEQNTEMHKNEVAKECNLGSDVLYSGTAIFDGQYNNEANLGCMDEFITQLKTYNWYLQNPAIDKIIKMQKLKVLIL